jgi:hypothetical protein
MRETDFDHEVQMKISAKRIQKKWATYMPLAWNRLYNVSRRTILTFEKEIHSFAAVSYEEVL